ncbi:MAG: cyclic nucleotide-binding domain-containing protein [Chloroflexi bacterium]|nr:cyclic nucleotide-binding domain-containing protein [Chloroflexota bacterium]
MASISPIDLLAMSSAEQTLLRHLIKQPQATIFELVANSKMSLTEVEQVLAGLLRQNRILEQLREGKRVFSTRFQFKRQTVRNMPTVVLNLLQQTADVFLVEAPITSELDDQTRDQLLRLAEKCTLLPDEVMAWQGQKTERIWLVQQGLLAQTRLKGIQTRQRRGYLHCGSWIGLSESLSEAPMTTTYTAVAPTTLLAWSASDFLTFASQQSMLAYSLNRYLSQRLVACQQAHLQKQSKLWVIEGVHPQAGVTTFAYNLACLAHQQADLDEDGRTLFWALGHKDEPQSLFPNGATAVSEKHVGPATIVTHASNLDVLTKVEPSGYAPQVQLDMLLTDLLAQYEYIICDTGSGREDELLLRLRGQAHTLITLTQTKEGADAGLQRWAALQPYSFPGQKRVLALNGAVGATTTVDPRFHLVIPADSTAVATAQAQQAPVVQAAADSPLCQSLHEVYRRLSLDHAVALFVPSTVDVNQQVDNSNQVKATLSFLGNLFGGATSSNAEGAWRSEESGLVTEQVTIVRTFVSKKALEAHLDDIIHFAADLKQDMKQEAVAISVDNQLILV